MNRYLPQFIHSDLLIDLLLLFLWHLPYIHKHLLLLKKTDPYGKTLFLSIHKGFNVLLFVDFEVLDFEGEQLRDVLEVKADVLRVESGALGDDLIEDVDEHLRKFFEILLYLLVEPNHFSLSTHRFLKLSPHEINLPEHLGGKALLVAQGFLQLFLQELKGRHVFVFEDEVKIPINHAILHLRSGVLDIYHKFGLFLVLAILSEFVEHGIVG